jgi:hypothetical protein
MRAKALGVPEEKHLRPVTGFDANVVGLVLRAIQDPSPFRVELNLLQIRWEYLEQNEVGHYFDLTALMIYGLKLQFLERIQDFKQERGQEVLDFIHAQNIEKEFIPESL